MLIDIVEEIEEVDSDGDGNDNFVFGYHGNTFDGILEIQIIK